MSSEVRLVFVLISIVLFFSNSSSPKRKKLNPTRAAVFLISKVFLLMEKHFSFCVLASIDKIRTATTVDQDVDQDSVGHECGWVGGGGAGHVLYSHRATAGSEAAPAQQLEPEPRPGSIRKKSGSKSLAEP